MRILRFAPLLALAAAPIVHAANSQACSDETVTAVARWAGIASARIATRDADRLVVASACKVMPNAPETTIAAVAFDSLPKSKNPDESSKLQVVALVEGVKVVAADRSVIQEDAAIQIGENSYRIDTAPYRLSPDVRAFGVVFSSTAHGPSCPDAYMENELTLWIREGARVRPVFGTNLNGWVATTGTACGPDTSDLRSESARMTIAVEKTSHNGFADLSITAHVMNAESNDDKQPDAGKRTVRTVVKYDGKSYGSDMYRDFWYSPASKRRFK
ncbi:MAG: multidrug ABC transporter ATPase [Burkholderia contaminans]|uniref:Multidrug ABC transporter ATPase n=1 Tax=Burkholderia contaminans TaxID=488447 RepID=A0AAP4VJ76_9BURK|nr:MULTISPECIES: multidrug ABC transporter ATPase [Burkholderia]MBD1416722.1 multidrug ABC transporter ATPase [Burkholderia contaminans]MBH9666588.1 multidrug ABC transporter ATPase [Burkholderia contaminans]MBH9673864.1 multidrug ABC transporter ATPase [Burkholderia contaminans]MBH9703909.1 multidrug ABC transporter ATPase [Burkholderia contaminans]MBH9719633.1 multidrug ABC transporter ATPase [Burkholderia contaminans]